MKGKIDSQGLLKIGRVGDIKYQRCPFTEASINKCGDWCPLFGEPRWEEDINSKWQEKRGWQLHLCKRMLLFTEFTDERVPE